MRVCYAAQVVSRSVAVAIRWCANNGKFEGDHNTKSALATAAFLEEMNRPFDILKGKVFGNKNPDKVPMTKNNGQVEKLKEFRAYLSKVALPKGSKVMSLRNLLYYIDGFLEMVEEILNVPGLYFVCPGCFNQDALENSYAILRSKLENNRNPSVREILILTGRLFSIKILRKGYWNYISEVLGIKG